MVIVLGDQLDHNSAALDGFDKGRDVVWMAEVAEESTHVWSHKARIALFLAAMRHFRNGLYRRGYTVKYRELDDPKNLGNFAAELRDTVKREKPEKLVLTEPGEFRVKEILENTATDLEVPLESLPDRHFLCSREDFAEYAAGRKQLRMEYFYRAMRRKTGVLIENGQPTGGKWNYDAENRDSFGRKGPGELPLPPSFPPDRITREVLRIVDRRFASHPGSLDSFDWPVTRR